jgi:hypothetical protein
MVRCGQKNTATRRGGTEIIGRFIDLKPRVGMTAVIPFRRLGCGPVVIILQPFLVADAFVAMARHFHMVHLRTAAPGATRAAGWVYSRATSGGWRCLAEETTGN